MKKFFTHFMAIIACLGISMNANAQFSATIEDFPTNDWSWKGHDFSLDEVATTLGTDAATLVAALDAWMAEEAPTEFLFQTADFVPTTLDDYAAANRGFWMSLDGVPSAWNDDVRIYSHFEWNAEAGTFTAGLGQRADALEPGATGHAILVLAYNGKKATFDLTLNVIEDPNATTIQDIDLSTLAVLMEATTNLPQYQGGTTSQEIDLTGVAAILGITDEELAANLANYLFVPTMELRGETEESQRPYMTTTLTNEPSANGVGWWLAAVWDEENEGFSEETARCVWADHAAFRSMFAEGFSYDAATHKLTCTTGWENSSIDLGTVFKFHLYLVNGTFAYHIVNVVTMTEKPYVDPGEYVEVGSEDVEVEFDYSSSQYAGANFSVDLDAILALMECEASDITLYGLQDEEGNWSDDYDAVDFRGFWFTAEGLVCKYASGYFYAGPTSENGWGEWLVGQYPGKNEEGAEFSTKLFLLSGNKYYTINLKVNIKKEDQSGKVDPSEWESVATWNISASTLPSTDGSYACDEEPAIDLDALEALIGTRQATLYGLKKTEDGEVYTKSWNCDPTPGFYITEDGWVGSWGAGDPWAFSYLPDGEQVLRFFQYPGKNELGVVRKGTFFLVNEETGKMVTLKLTLIFGEATQYDDLGSADVMLPYAYEDVNVDFSTAVEGMGITGVRDILGTNLRAVLDDGQWSDLMSAGDGVAINANGGLDLSSGNSESVVYITPIAGDDENTITLQVEKGNTALEAGKQIQTKLSFEYEAEDGSIKRYILNITIVDEETFVGIDSVSSKGVNAKAYDLSGRRSDMSQKGIYIVGGKKVVK